MLEAQRGINKLVYEFQQYRPGTPDQLQHWWKRLQSAKKRAGGIDLPCQSHDHMMQEGLAMVDVGFELWEVRSDLRRDLPQTDAEMRVRRARLQSAKRRAGGIGLPYRSYDHQMAWMARLSAGAETERVEPQQQHAPGVETLGDDSEPPESKLAVTGVVQAEQQQEPSPPMTSAEPFPRLLDEPYMVHGDVVSGVAIRPEGGAWWFGCLGD